LLDRCRLRLRRACDDEDDEDDRERERKRERERERERDRDWERVRERERDNDRLGGERTDCLDDEDGFIEFFNSSINVIEVVFNGRFLDCNFLLVSIDEAVVKSAILESATIRQSNNYLNEIESYLKKKRLQQTWSIRGIFTGI
jgi:hypothetical protein